MDPSANLSDSRSESLKTLSDTHTEEMEPSLPNKTTYVESLVYKRHAEAVADPPKPLCCMNKSVSKRPEIETVSDHDCLRSLSPNGTSPEWRFVDDHTNLQPISSAVNCHRKKSDLSVHKYSTPSTSNSPQITSCLPSAPSCHTVPSKTLPDLYHKEAAVHYSLKQDPSTSKAHRMVSPTLISLMDRPQSDQTDPETEWTPCSLEHDSNNIDPSTLISDLSSGLTESDCAVEHLFILESETQDFLNLSSQSNPALDHQISSDRPSVFPQSLFSNTLFPSEDILQGAMTESHNHLFKNMDLDSDSEPCTQQIGLEPPTGTDNAWKHVTPVGETGSTSHVNSQVVQSDNPIDLWMDACQYMSSQDKGAGKPDSEGIIVDQSANSALSEGADITAWSWPCPSADREMSGHPSMEQGDAMRRVSSGDIGVWGPPLIERWSSVDSWETALSDWAAIIASPPEEITAAFTEIGAEIDALTQALARDSEARNAMALLVKTTGHVSTREDTLLRGREDTGSSDVHPQTQMMMDVPDQSVESQPSSDRCVSPVGSSSTITAPSPNTPTDPAVVEDHLEVKPESSTATPREENRHTGEIKSARDQDSIPPVDTHSSSSVSSVMLTSLGECSIDVRTAALISGHPGIPAVLEESDPDVVQFRGYVGPTDRDGDTSNGEDDVWLHIEEDVDEDLERECAQTELKFEGPHGGAVYKVTAEDLVPQHDSSVADRDLRHGASELTDSPPTVVESETLESEAAGEEPYCLTDATHTLRNTHVPLGDAINQASHETPLQQNVLCSSEGPASAIPAAPLAIGSQHLCVTINGLEGDQDFARVEVFDDNKEASCPHTKTCVPLPALEAPGRSPLRRCHQNKTQSTDGTEHSNSEEEIKGESPVSLDDDVLQRGLCHLGGRFTTDRNALDINQDIEALSRELANLVSVPGAHFLHSEKRRLACFTLDLVDPFFPRATKDTAPQGLQNGDRPGAVGQEDLTMPHKMHRSNLDFKARPKKVGPTTGLHPATPTCKRQENLSANAPGHDNHTKVDPLNGQEGKEDGAVTAVNGPTVSDVPVAKSLCKKKKKHTTQNATVVMIEPEPPLVKEEKGTKQKAMDGKISAFEAKFGPKISKTKDKVAVISGKLESAQADGLQQKSQHPEAKALAGKEPPNRGTHVKLQETPQTNQINEDAVKRRRLSEKKFGKMVSALESKINKTEVATAPKREEAKAGVDTTRRKAYSDVVKQKPPREEPKVVVVIQVEPVSGDPLSLCLWCQFSGVVSDHTVTWSREGRTLSELKRSGGDESRVSLTISKASHQDLGKYQCVLTSLHGSLSLDYLLTYEVLSQIVVLATPKTIPCESSYTSPVDIVGNEENVRCSRLLFREDFLSQQYFGENQVASIVTEPVHFGEGMHRRAFRTKLQAGLVSQLEPGNICVLKVHTSITYGTKDNDELVQKNFSLAVEECQVQNTAREYIKAYTTVAQSAEAFGEVPEIIPIYLVHRPSNAVPYATLEEELIGDFVKYSVRDGKEINLKRSDSEAGQKCCAFQHWVYDNTDGNLLVTDMQGVGMRLTDVGIATCKKGYKGFRGNCATSFIDQFKALHMCNKYCEILGLASLQPKPKKTFLAPKPKPQPSSALPKKKTFGPTVKGKS
ncbi:alpha-protein kinase 2 isoform X1 [Gadus chalcogrammus]|uniref:alpha-protein kinase 2 isoform X1 n=1 Tax=Gadus chalcogrammus TaxID=1042646 RepID=UPI0024C49DE4|nr:alpha-protein kinase 2 isoform X1 [Gadus chalcogrammus]XP_056434490.1 alpha-protein kinase 2 isoform X1 [Gadus chalcogrammus]XP_056434491.1 alpha-protein kinase 2 isoform X1 [Gadus chalcogrammus]